MEKVRVLSRQHNLIKLWRNRSGRRNGIPSTSVAGLTQDVKRRCGWGRLRCGSSDRRFIAEVELNRFIDLKIWWEETWRMKRWREVSSEKIIQESLEKRSTLLNSDQQYETTEISTGSVDSRSRAAKLKETIRDTGQKWIKVGVVARKDWQRRRRRASAPPASENKLKFENSITVSERKASIKCRDYLSSLKIYTWIQLFK